MDDFLQKLRDRRNQLAAPGGELGDTDFDSPLPNALISDGKSQIESMVNGEPAGNDFLDKLQKRREQLSAENKPERKIIATTDDGGKVYELADGTRSFSSPGYSTSDPERIAKIMEGATPADVSRSGFNQDIIDQNPIAARATKFVEGTPFIGSYLDEAADVVLGEDAGDAIRATSRAMDEEKPGQSMALNVGGGVTGSLAIAGATLPKAKKLFEVGSPALRATLAAIVGGGAGATEGAIYGYGRQEEDGRLANAKSGATWGAALGTLFAGGGSVAADGVERIAKRLKKLDISVIQSEFNLSKPAAKAVKVALEGEDLDAAARALRGLGDEAMLADAGPATGAMLDAVAQTGGEALRVTRQAVEGRVNRMTPKMNTAFNLAFGTPKGTKEAFGEISDKSAGLRKRAYDAAFSKPVNYAKQSGQNIEAVLERVPPKTMRAAVAEANEAMISEGLQNAQIMAEITDDGAVFREMPNVQQLHEIKRALQSIGQSETDAVTGKISAKGARANKLARELRIQLEAAVPEYKRASKLGGDKILEEQAFQTGQKLFHPGTTVEEITQLMADATPATRRAAKEGVRNFLENSMSHVRMTITDGNTEAREALQAIKMFSSRANRQKLVQIVGKQNAERVLNSVDQTAQAFELRAMVATNSKTAPRQAIQEQVKEMAQPHAVSQLAQGNVGDASKQLVQALTGVSSEISEAKKREMFAEIARSLTDRRGFESQRALQLVQGAIEGQPIKDADAALIASMVNPVAIMGDAYGREKVAR